MNFENSIVTMCFAGALTACGGGGSATSAVNPPVVNTAPIANAGKDQSVIARAVVTFDASASSDANSDMLTYKWSLDSKPVGSATVLSSLTGQKPTLTPDLEGVYYVTLIVNDGKVDSTKSGVTINVAKAGLDTLPAPNLPTEGSIPTWLISKSTSALTGLTTTILNSSSNEGDFIITCNSDGTYQYYFKSSTITANGAVSMRVGFNPIISETWTESSSNGYRVLFPPKFRIDLLQMFYNNWDFVFQYNGYASGVRTSENGSSGFSSAIDKTRADCKWSTDLFPPQNGWGKALPMATPANAIQGTDVSGRDVSTRVGLIAWRDINAFGKQQLIVRVGDPINTQTPWLINDHRFYVTQSGKTVSAVSGFDFQSSSRNPTVLALNGDFDASLPFVLTLYDFHLHTIDTKTALTTVTFN